MNLKVKFLRNKLIALIGIGFFAFVAMSYEYGPASGGHLVTGAPFDEGTCGESGCHHGGSFAPTITIQLLSGGSPVTSYTAGSSYTLEIKLSSSYTSSSTRWGFQTVCVVDGTSTDVNGWGTLPSSVHSVLSSSRHYIEHDNYLTLSSGTGTVDIPWTAPSSGTGSVKFYACGNMVNYDGSDLGDSPKNDSLLITESVVCVPPVVSSTVTNVSCHGGNDGAINLTVTGGSTYSWTGPGTYTSTSEDISGLVAGNYTLIATASGGCSDTTVVTVTQPAAISLSASSDAPVCVGSTLHLNSSAGGGTGSFLYSWNGPGGFTSSSPSPTFTTTSTSAGTYSLTVTDAHGCSASTTVDVTLNPAVGATASNDGPVCVGQPLGFTGTGGGGTGTLSYSWTGPAGYSGTDASFAINPSAADNSGTYTLTVTDAVGCSATATTDASVGTSLPVSLGSDVTTCSGSVTLDAGDPGSTYVWSTGETTETVTETTSGTYWVTVTGAGGCVGSDTINISIGTLPFADSIRAVPTSGNSFDFSAASAAHTDSYFWLFGDGTISSDSTPSHTYSFIGTYAVTVVLTNTCGTYTITDSVTVDSGAVEEVSAQMLRDGLAIYPNPASSSVTIFSYGGNKIQAIAIYAMSGAKMHEEYAGNNKSYQLQVQDLAAGVYTVYITTDKGVITRKLVIQK